LLLTDIATAQSLGGTSGRLSQIDLILPESFDTAKLSSILPAGTLLVPSERRNGQVAAMTKAFQVNLTALSLLALVVGVFLIYNAMTFSVIQRRPLFGTLRTYDNMQFRLYYSNNTGSYGGKSTPALAAAPWIGVLWLTALPLRLVQAELASRLVALGPDASRWFAVIAAGDKVPMKKPAPDIYDLALAVLGLASEACVAFEDSGKGLAAAKAAGLFTVVTPTFWTQTDDLSAADLLLPSLGDPEAPLDPGAAGKVGAPFVGLGELERLKSSRAATHTA